MSGNEVEATAGDGIPLDGSSRKSGLFSKLASVRLVLWLVGILAAAMAVATVVPQRAPEELYNHALGHLVGPLIHRSTLRDVYGSWWFIGAFAVLALSLLVCAARRAGRLLRASGTAAHVTKSTVLARPYHSEWRVALDTEAAAAALREGLRKAGYAVRSSAAPGGAASSLTARRGLATEWGTVLLHMGMALVLLGAAYGRLPAHSYRVVADLNAEESYEVESGGDTFSIRLLDAGQERDPEGRPTRFWAEAEILEAGKVVRSALIEPNRPLRHRGVNAVLQSLSSAGYFVEVSKGETLSTVPVVFAPDGTVAMLDTVRVIEDPSWVVFIHDFRSSAAGDESAPAAHVFVDPTGELSHNWEAVGWVGQEGLVYSGVSFRLVPGGQGAQLLLDRDVGVPIVWLGFCVIVLGSLPLLGVRRRTVVALVSPRGGAASVYVGASDARIEPDIAKAFAAADVKAKNMAPDREREAST